MTTTIFVGTSFGDEGKARIIDDLSENATMVVRSAGGANAGHTVVVNGKKTIFKLIPSGILREGVKCVLGQGMVIDLITLTNEMEALEKSGVNFKDRLFISDKAHVVTYEHKDIDAKRNKLIGTTKRGIGPAYEAKISRRAKRLKEVLGSRSYGKGTDLIRKCVAPNTSFLINKEIANGGTVFLEGAQGTLLDIDHGTYPYVTSSNCTAGGACTGTGISPLKIDKVIGITKSYLTRVGNGPFPTELVIPTEADWLRERGHEYGSVTGRPRRVGWLDLPLLKYSHMINGFTSLAMTKLDILSGKEFIPVCTGYSNMSFSEFDIDKLDSVDPEYSFLEGWREDIAQVRSWEDLPKNARKYIEFVEAQVGVPIDFISVGPERSQTIRR